MTEKQRKKLLALKHRLNMDPAIYVDINTDGLKKRWYMTDFTCQQFKGNLKEMRKLLDEILTEEEDEYAGHMGAELFDDVEADDLDDENEYLYDSTPRNSS